MFRKNLKLENNTKDYNAKIFMSLGRLKFLSCPSVLCNQESNIFCVADRELLEQEFFDHATCEYFKACRK